MSSLKAIQTRYKGYHFRSRLEARWAVFFDTAGIKWEYEVEGFQLPNGTRYLPDFKLPETNTWVEIKGACPSDQELETCSHFARALNPEAGDNGCVTFAALLGGEEAVSVVKQLQEYSADEFGEVISLGEAAKKLTGHLRSEPKILMFCGLFEETWLFSGKYQVKAREPAGPVPWLFNIRKPAFITALEAARGARFEHGQSGATT